MLLNGVPVFVFVGGRKCLFRVICSKTNKKNLFKANTTELFAFALAHKLAVKKAKTILLLLIGWHKLNRISKES